MHRSTEAGHIGYILDEQKQICNADNTGVWLNNEFFPCDRSNGAIFIPYTRYQQHMQVIMIHENFAQLTEFCRDSERYGFNAFFHANAEQFIEGHQATILIRPKLLINSHKASLALLSKNKAYLSIKSVAATAITRIFENLQFKDDEETLITFQVPSQFESATIYITSSVFNKTEDQHQALTSTSKVFENDSSNNFGVKMQDVYLRREGDQYFLLTLGKNGDPLSGKQLEVTAVHKNNTMEPFTESLVSDKNGKVGLGTLKDINNIEATSSGGGRR